MYENKCTLQNDALQAECQSCAFFNVAARQGRIPHGNQLAAFMDILSTLFIPEVFLVWTSLAKTLVLLGIILGLVSYTVYAERKVCALIQDRVGPNRVGIPLTKIRILGLGQPIADAFKLVLKENFIPASVNKFYYYIAPKLSMVPPILVLAVLPFGSFLFRDANGHAVPMVIANLNIGVLYVFAVSSLGVYGIVLAGWASNSKYPFLGGIRSSSQMISYELALGLSVIPVFMLCRTLNLSDIVFWQRDNGWLVAPFWPMGLDLSMVTSGLLATRSCGVMPLSRMPTLWGTSPCDRLSSLVKM